MKEVFESALGRGPDERLAFVEQACDGDKLLRREVESLLASYEEDESFMERPAVAAAAETLAGSQRESLVGQTIGHYQVTREIGSGGMGEVYLAQDTRLDRKVALKLILEEFSRDGERLRRFTQEAKAASALNHPNIITIYDIGQENGLHYIATEYIEGETLRQHIRRSQMNIAEVLDVAIQIATALSAAHQAGITHRDIKPENIMIRPDRYVKVLDFGLAKLTEQQAPTTDRQAPTFARVDTEPGLVVGTIKYMSPEHARGLPVDARSDIFSFGVLLYEMVSDHVPFDGATIAVTFIAILERDPLPLSPYLPYEWAGLEQIILKCLEKDRDRRYQSAREVVTALKNLTSDRPKEQPARKPVSSIAVLPFVNMSADSENEYFCDGLAEELSNALTKIERLRVAARTSAFSFKGKEIEIQEIGQKLRVESVLEGSVRKAGNSLRITVQLVSVSDGYRLWSERYDRRMEDVFEIQDEITLAIVAALKVKLLGLERERLLKRYTDNAEAYQAYLKGRYYWNKRSAEGFKKAIEYFNQAIAIDPSYALAYAGLADCYGLLSNYDITSPREAMPKAKAAALKALEIDDALAEAHTSLGLVKKDYEWDFAGAEWEFKRAIDLNPNYATAYHWYAENLVILGRFGEANAVVKRAQELDPLSLMISGQAGWVLFHLRQYDKAIEQYQKTLEIDSSFWVAHLFLGIAYEQKAMYEEAITEIQKARELSGGHVETFSFMGHVYATLGKRSEAQKVVDELNERSRREYVSPLAIAIIHLGLGEEDRGIELLEKAYEERDTILVYFLRYPHFDGLRPDPRFQDLLRRLNLKR